jgi:uncharacterized small protein (DUF1192 family)
VHCTVARATLARLIEVRKPWLAIPTIYHPKKPLAEIVIGQDLSAMSEFELATRIERLEAEIARCREAIKARQTTKAAAAAFFKKP